MDREIRMVPPNWQHPKDDRGAYQPMYEHTFDVRFAEWLSDFDRIRRGDLDDIERRCYAEPGMVPLIEWLCDEGAFPDRAYYVPYTKDQCTWFQYYENVTEGTPISPPFATAEELVDWLEHHGDPVWGAMTRAQCERMVKNKYAPSMIMSVPGKIQGGVVADEE